MEESRGSASSPATGMAVGNPIEESYISIFGVDGPQLRSASSPATGMAEETVAITREAVKDPRDEEWLISIFGEDGQQPDPEPRPKHRIPKVPTKFRKYEKDKKYFDPQVVSLGPYHHDDEHLKPMEKHKITAAKQFVDELKDKTGGRGTIYEKFMELTGDLKKCYDAEVVPKRISDDAEMVPKRISDDDFARMMFLDGCFVLHFIDKISEGAETILEKSTDLIPLIIRDMFLIENQLPFEFLDALMNLRRGYGKSGKENMQKFFTRKVLIPMGFWPVNPSWSSNWRKVVDGGEHDRPLHLLDILRTILLDFPPSNWTKEKSYRPPNFGSVMELKETGIRFEKRRTKSLMDISYKENLLFPQLLLPTMYINDTTISQLLNLTAFEAFSYSGCGVTSYIHFMDSLIKDDANVKMLRSKGILLHSLGSDDELARLFNTWPADATNNLQLYSDIIKQIRLHRRRTVKIYIATLAKNYFVAASLILVLTAIQTYFAAFPRR